MIDKDLKIYDSVCTGCSACTEVCTFPDKDGINPIQLFLNKQGLAVPRINSDTCTECMMCYKACPTEDKIFNNDVSFESYKENIGESYFGYTLDKEHRFEAATAGISTEIAAYLLDTKKVDAVVSSYQDDTNSIITQIYTDSNKIKKSRGSIYRQVSLLNGLAEKIQSSGHKRLLVIGLPCHIAGLKTLHKTNNYLKKNVEFITIALFCKQTKTEEFSDIQRRMLHAKSNETINYRGKGWPGITSVEGRRSLPSTNMKFSLMWSSFAFTPDYCFSCSDPIGVEADISVGDAWLSKYYKDDQGSSLFVANTGIGNKIIKSMHLDGKIHLEEETVENVILSQSLDHIKFKTEMIKERTNYFTKLYTTKIASNPLASYKWILFNKQLIEFIYTSNIISYIPELLLKVYRKIYNIILGKVI